MDSSGGRKRLLAGDLPNSVRSIVWASDNSGVFYLMPERGVANVYFVSRDGESRAVTAGNHVLSQLTLAANGQAAAVRSTSDRPGYLVTFPMMPGASATSPDEMSTLADVNADVLDGVRLGQVDELLFESPDGLDLQGWLMKPPSSTPRGSTRSCSGSTADRTRCTRFSGIGLGRTSPQRDTQCSS